MRLATYLGRDLDHLSVRETDTVRQTMTAMNRAGLRLVPVLAAEGEGFAGVVADGDLRRFLADGGGLDAPVGKATNRQPRTTAPGMAITDVRSFMLRCGIEHLPVVEDGRLVAFYVLWAVSGPQEMTAVIMAGGLGSRLFPLTDNCPKPLLSISGKPILRHIVENLREQGVSRFVFSVNYLADMIMDYFGDGSSLEVRIDYLREPKRLGTGGALGLLDANVPSDPFLCLNGDILSDVDVNALKEQHEANKWDATMVVREHAYTIPYGVVKSGENGEYISSEEKPTVPFLINAGIYLLSRPVLSIAPRNTYYDLPTLFKDVQSRNMSGGTYLHKGRWIDIGSLEEFERAKTIFGGA